MSVVINFPKEAEGSSSGGMGNIWANYLALVRGASGNELDAVFGRNNEDLVQGLGMSLAMYAKFKDPTIDIEETFPNLAKCDTMDEIMSNSDAELEMKSNSGLKSLAKSTNYLFTGFAKFQQTMWKIGDDISYFSNRTRCSITDTGTMLADCSGDYNPTFSFTFTPKSKNGVVIIRCDMDVDAGGDGRNSYCNFNGTYYFGSTLLLKTSFTVADGDEGKPITMTYSANSYNSSCHYRIYISEIIELEDF